MYRFFFKRFFDIFFSFFGLLIFSPVFLVITVCLYFVNEGKPFFFQKRPGKNGKIFSIIKFKSMNEKKDANGRLLPDEQRLTGIGKFIRNASLDEIPQLINVLKGDMSLIGPRPLLERYLDYYNDFEKRRHEVRPGITGWAQINGRNAISWHRKFELDVYYVDHLSLWFDIKILFKTIKKVLSSDDIALVPIEQFFNEKIRNNESKEVK
ncbi:sugar transferase [Emticicia sp. TH156]|uniref:sugar transferase n=1 Tax=Emticicia sp. TH156 TaxID=2067454 RepID=UPI000C760BD1|nr:sugar transferase [Emticicia sp. TH156]PLK42248.1 lipid carrier--UDP-N-acetylgalactosaminyltransferase [Emticicia sp. TH156]